eukprot:2792621-Prymnesium_polylepis.1
MGERRVNSNRYRYSRFCTLWRGGRRCVVLVALPRNSASRGTRRGAPSRGACTSAPPGVPTE